MIVSDTKNFDSPLPETSNTNPVTQIRANNFVKIEGGRLV